MFAQSDVISRAQQSGTSEGEAYPLVSRKSDDSSQPINVCSESSCSLLVPFAVLGAPTEGYQKVVQYGLPFWYHSQLLTMETDIIAYRTVPSRTAQWKRTIRDTFYELGIFFNSIMSDHFCSGSNIY